jgi:hypothetical protein
MPAQTITSSSLVVAPFALLLCVTTAATAFECPTSQPGGEAGAIKGTPDQIAEFSTLLGGDELGARISRAVEALRKRYPDAESAELANFLIMAYCPNVNAMPGLSDAEKTAKLRAFADRVLDVLY